MAQPPADEMKDLSPLEDQEEDNTVAKSLKHVEEKKEVASVTRFEELATQRTTMKAQSTASIVSTTTPGREAPAAGQTPASTVASPPPSAGRLTAEQQARLIATQRAALKRVRGEFDFIAVPDWVVLHPLLGCYLAEAIGTFVFTLTAALCLANNPMLPKQPQTNIVSLPIGFMLMCMVFTFGYISGAHFNPAITISVFLSRQLELKKAVGYIVCQCAASFGAGLVAMIIQGSNNIAVPNAKQVTSSIFGELIYTFALCTVVLHVSCSTQKANFFYGFAIGMTITAGVAATSSVASGVFNPAVATGLQVAYCLTGSCDYIMTFWVFWLSPVMGAILASLIFCNMHQPQKGLSDSNV